MYNVGDRFIIEIDRVYKSDGRTLYGIRGYNALVFDDAGLLRLDRPSKVQAVQTCEGILIKGASIEETVHECETCRYVGNSAFKKPCNTCLCNAGTEDNWEQDE